MATERAQGTLTYQSQTPSNGLCLVSVCSQCKQYKVQTDATCCQLQLFCRCKASHNRQARGINAVCVVDAVWCGVQVWQMHNYGDSLRLYIDPPQFDTFGMLGWWDKGVGSSRAAVSQWIGANVVLGGPTQLYQRAANIWGEWNDGAERYGNRRPVDPLGGRGHGREGREEEGRAA